MLGEQIADMRGKVTNQRILPSDGVYPKSELTFEVNGAFLGVESTMMGTYQNEVRPDGSLHGECLAGLLMTQEGETTTWIGAGAGRFTGQGSAASFRGCVYYQTASQKLARLNGMAVVYEWEVDPDGNTHGILWEWK